MGDVRGRSMNFAELPRGSLFALMLIVAGALLFLDNLGILPIQDIRAYWPIWIVIWGVHILDRRRGQVASVWALALIAWGTLLILGNLHILHITGSVFWPVMLIAFGVSMLLSPTQFRGWPDQLRLSMRNVRPPGARESFFGNKLHESLIFGSLNRRVESQQFEGGKVDVVFGSIELDLSGASISAPDRRASLDANAVFGGIEITVPRTWKVVMKNGAVFGGCEDKTFPPRPEPGFEPVTLVVTGAAVFGGIEIRN
jgi:predicted membrane protein